MRSLTAKLVLFLLAFSVPALLVVEISVLSFEYGSLVRALDAGALERESKNLAQEIFAHLEDPPEEIRLRLNNARLSLQDPKSTWLGEPFVLSELAVEPIRITLRRSDGTLWVAATGAPMTPDAGARRWRGDANVPGASEFVRIELALAPPWRRIRSVFSFEWPVMVACLLLVGVGAGIFLHRVVLKRLDRIAVAAEGWSRERFATPLKDTSSDEIGILTRRLNDVATALRARMDERARLAALEERERLAQDLHDSVKQHGFALELQLGALSAVLPKPQNDDIDGSTPVSAAQRALEEAQQLSLQIRRELDVILGQLRVPGEVAVLEDALRRRLEDFSRRSGIEWQLDVRCEKPSKLSPGDLAEVLRIVDEALANIWRHSGAATVRIELRQTDRVYSLDVIDDGCGFALGIALSKDSMGLKNLALRARRLPSGRLNIQTAEQVSAGGHGKQVSAGGHGKQVSAGGHGKPVGTKLSTGTKVELQWLE
jgi:signal transduction histidine kinase